MDVEDEFVDLCINCELEKAHRLFLLNNIDIFRKYSDIFHYFCRDEYINIAKWLLLINGKPFSSTIPDSVTITSSRPPTIQDELRYMFVESCRYGRIETAKWLYSLGVIDVHEFSDAAFQMGCRYIEIVKFLLSIDNRYVDVKYNYSYYDDITKLLFDHNHRASGTYDFIKMADHFVEKYKKMKESMMTALTDHLIPDIADLVYYYV
jgi:hypothetical protein